MLKVTEKNLSFYQEMLLAVFLGGFLFFLQEIHLIPLPFLQNLARRWQAGNFSLLQKVFQPWYRVKELWNVTAKLEDLQYRYAEAAATAVRLKDVEKENQELHQILENSDRRRDIHILTTPVISYGQAILPVGQQDGVQVGAMVLANDNLVGLISEVQTKESQITLLSQMTEMGIMAETETNIKGLVKGNGREVLFTEVARDQEVQVGQLITTIGQPGIEKGILIGKIRELPTDNPAQATRSFVIEQLVDFYQVPLVEIK